MEGDGDPARYRSNRLRGLWLEQRQRERAAALATRHGTHPPREPDVDGWSWEVGDRVLLKWDHGTTRAGTVASVQSHGWLIVRHDDDGPRLGHRVGDVLDVHRA